MRGYYFITDAGLSRAGNLSDVQNALTAGVRVVQYRENQSETGAIYEEALKLGELCRGVRFLINDRVDLALAAVRPGADYLGGVPYFRHRHQGLRRRPRRPGAA